jgi:hypothetical protein
MWRKIILLALVMAAASLEPSTDNPFAGKIFRIVENML